MQLINIFLSCTDIGNWVTVKFGTDCNLSEWLSTNKLILNLKKTEFMIFGTHQKLCRQHIDRAHVTLRGESVKHCDAFK